MLSTVGDVDCRISGISESTIHQYRHPMLELRLAQIHSMLVQETLQDCVQLLALEYLQRSLTDHLSASMTDRTSACHRVGFLPLDHAYISGQMVDSRARTWMVITSAMRYFQSKISL